MKVGEVFRYARPYEPSPKIIDGLPNYFYSTFCKDSNMPLLDSGINPIRAIKAPEGWRIPAILISSSPHRLGTSQTPWQDFFDPDTGYIRYYGDNKLPVSNPELAPGNKRLLEAFRIHNYPEIGPRSLSVPIIFFRRVRYGGKAKGFVQFQGFGIISRAELVTQYDRFNKRYFSNYVFGLTVFSLAKEAEDFNWDWINLRRNPDLTLADTLKIAPASWKRWIKHGTKALDQCRRRVAKLLVTSTGEQRPDSESDQAKVLREIYKFYEAHNRRRRFEALAAKIAGKVLEDAGGRYTFGWITPPTADGGADFIGRLDLGSEFSTIKVLVYGQAKCEGLRTPTSGRDIARTVARLQRGWIGVYVTTSYFSEAVQREVIHDKYPIMLIHGKRLAAEVIRLSYEEGYQSINAFLIAVDATYDGLVQVRDAEEILLI